jgi:hypothetical protein
MVLEFVIEAVIAIMRAYVIEAVIANQATMVFVIEANANCGSTD